MELSFKTYYSSYQTMSPFIYVDRAILRGSLANRECKLQPISKPL